MAKFAVMNKIAHFETSREEVKKIAEYIKELINQDITQQNFEFTKTLDDCVNAASSYKEYLAALPERSFSKGNFVFHLENKIFTIGLTLNETPNKTLQYHFSISMPRGGEISEEDSKLFVESFLGTEYSKVEFKSFLADIVGFKIHHYLSKEFENGKVA